MPDPAPSAPDAAARSWVWHATVESRAAGKVSVLACVETLFAVALYWWIAIRWDTHWPLLSSVFIAPLLLLRSPESMKLGVRWFTKDWFGFENYNKWPNKWRWFWQFGASVLTGVTTYTFARWLCGLLLADKTGWTLFFMSALLGSMSLLLAGAVAFALVGAIAGTRKAETARISVIVPLSIGASLVAVGWALGWGIGVVCAIIGLVAASRAEILSVWITISGMGIGVGISVRAVVCRVAATLLHLLQGGHRLAENWQENNFWVDCFVPAELMPGIREESEHFTFENIVACMHNDERPAWRWFVWPSAVVILFLPAFLYRLNIKATCWFWWPLAYLLKPVPKADKVSAQKQALCWPWDNPMQMLLILVPGVLVLGILAVEYCDFGVWKEFKNAAAVPIPLKVALGMGWGHIPPWHWALLVVELAGLMMLAIAGKARSHRASDDWESYAQQCGMQRDLWLMDKLMRLRSLAAKAFMVLGLGMCLISFPEWRQYVPDAVMRRMERFYGTQEQSVPAPAGHSPGQ